MKTRSERDTARAARAERLCTMPGARSKAPIRDERPETAGALALRRGLDGSPQVAQLKEYEALMNGRGTGDEVAPVAAERDGAADSNRSGLPIQLKAGVEQLSGLDLAHVTVHYNSPQPARMNAYAYTRAHEIHLGPGQERYLPHEAWHVVQQMQRRVRPTGRTKNGEMLNDDAHLEREADYMGRRALYAGSAAQAASTAPVSRAHAASPAANVLQAATRIEHTAGEIGLGSGKQVVGRKMVAALDVTDPVLGTATGTQWVWTRELRYKYRQAGVVRGHLLNHDLGGSAIPANLYPISTKANAEHSSKVEQHVKQLLNKASEEFHERLAQLPASTPVASDDAMSDVAPGTSPEIVHYSVTVEEAHAGDPGLAAFACEFRMGDEPAKRERIVSSLAEDKDRYLPGASLIPGMDKVQPHPDWAHRGKHARDLQWVANLRRQQQMHLDMAANLGQHWPEETNVPQHDYEIIWSQFVTNARANATAYRTPDALYKLDQEAVKKYLMKHSQFLEEMLENALYPPGESQIVVWLGQAAEGAAHVVKPELLPVAYRKGGKNY